MELDHLFIMCAVEAPEAAALVRAGLVEGSPNSHPGQGTACRRFFFENAYLELIWVHDEEAARQPALQPLHLWERWAHRSSRACPFGIVVRPCGETTAPPFPAWPYHPPYFAEGVVLHVGRDTTLEEPAVFFMGFQRGRARPGQEPDRHALPVRRLTGVSIGLPRPSALGAACTALEAAAVRIHARDAYRCTLEFDDATRGGEADLSPALPLVLRW